jgi:hypothetical protein
MEFYNESIFSYLCINNNNRLIITSQAEVDPIVRTVMGWPVRLTTRVIHRSLLTNPLLPSYTSPESGVFGTLLP